MPTPRAVRRQTLAMDRPDFEEVVVERSLYSFKLYQDIAMVMRFTTATCRRGRFFQFRNLNFPPNVSNLELIRFGNFAAIYKSSL